MTKNLSLLTSADAVKAAIAECDKLGRENFLKQYGYAYSRKYPLHYNGKVYDSKAIAGVAFGKQFGAALKAKDFSGGTATVVPVLKKLGFSAIEASHPTRHLVVGQIYFRKDLVDLYGGQLQAGIWTPKEFPVVFVFSGDSGKAYGYTDGWADGVYQYSGEGQLGDMTFTGGNKAILEHRKDGKDLLLFNDLGKGKGVRFQGLFECASWRKVDGLDKNKQTRNIIVFDLVPVTTAATDGGADEPHKSGSMVLSLEELRKAALLASATPAAQPRSSDAKRSWYERSTQVRDYVLARAGGICESCELPAPFKKKNGTPYLEPHHTTRLADEGPDHPSWVAAICPNCHRRVHSGDDGHIWNQRIREKLKKIEPIA